MKVGIFTTNGTFLDPVIAALKRAGHELRMWTATSQPTVNWMNLVRLLDRVDVAFFDWCQQPFLEAMSLEELPCKVAVRAHGIPFFGIYKAFPWNKVDLFVGASDLFRSLLQEAKQRPRRYAHIPVGSDPLAFTLPKRKRYGRRLVTHSYTIRFKKRVYTTIQSFYDLLQHDRRWDLYVVGDWTGGGAGWEGVNYTEPCRELMRELEISTKVYLTPNMPRATWHNFLCTKDVYVSNSIREGVNLSLAEAMMTGVYPVINCWRGARDYYPEACIVKTQRALVDRILDWGKLTAKEKRAHSAEMRRWAAERFDAAALGDQLVQELETLG